VGVFLPNNRDIVDFWGEEILRLRAPDDGYSIKYILVYMLDSTRTRDHDRKYYICI